MILPSDNAVIASTRQWVDDVVVGLNFCPFAKKEVERQTIRYQVCRQTVVNDCIQTLLDELYLLDKEHDIETTLLILPQGFEAFDSYLDLVDIAEAIIDQSGYRGIYQLATFHPDYCFEGLSPDKVENCTNRAPYPTLHLIREASIERVLRVFPDPENIPVRNGIKAQEMGMDYFHSLLKTLLSRQ